MSEETEHVARRRVVYSLPGMEEVSVRRDIEYRADEAGALTLDIYYPPSASGGTRLPAVVFVAGYPDEGFAAHLGCKFKEMGALVSWGRLTAAAGVAAVTYTNREPARDAHAVLEYVRRNADALGVDENRIGLWAGSGNVPLALSLLMREGGERPRCAVLCYGYTLDLAGSEGVAEASRTWGFVNPCAARRVGELPPRVPLFVARAGRDEMPRLNETLDRFVCEALKHNLPLTLTNHAEGRHAFDLFDDGETSREVVRQILAFMRVHLLDGSDGI